MLKDVFASVKSIMDSLKSKGKTHEYTQVAVFGGVGHPETGALTKDTPFYIDLAEGHMPIARDFDAE